MKEAGFLAPAETDRDERLSHDGPQHRRSLAGRGPASHGVSMTTGSSSNAGPHRTDWSRRRYSSDRSVRRDRHRRQREGWASTGAPKVRSAGFFPFYIGIFIVRLERDEPVGADCADGDDEAVRRMGAAPPGA